MSHGMKRRRNHRRRESSITPPIDKQLYQANYDAADSLRAKINSLLGNGSFKMPPCQFRLIAKYKQLDMRPAPARPQNTDHCTLCEAGSQSALSLSRSTTAFLTLEQQRVAVLHDQLVLSPISHVQSTLYLDENTLTELRNYQKTLVRMFYEQEKAVIFVETSLGDPYLKDTGATHRVKSQHCRIECYPIPLDVMEEAKSFFRKAITDLVPEWAQNKKVIVVTGKTGVRNIIPKGFDYIYVDYSLSGEGLACTIEDATTVPPSFTREVIAGVLNMDAMERAFRSRDGYNQAFSWLKKNYQKFDWTNTT